MTGEAWLQKHSRRKRRRKNKRKRANGAKRGRVGLQVLAAKLREIDYPSERWFRKLWTDRGMLKDKTNAAPLFLDHFNIAVPPYIPDVINYGYRYIIEIDGKYHAKRQVEDRRRDEYFLSKMGIRTYRIPAYDKEAFNRVCEEVRLRRIAIDSGDTPDALLTSSELPVNTERAAAVDAMVNGTYQKPDPAPWITSAREKWRAATGRPRLRRSAA